MVDAGFREAHWGWPSPQIVRKMSARGRCRSTTANHSQLRVSARQRSHSQPSGRWSSCPVCPVSRSRSTRSRLSRAVQAHIDVVRALFLVVGRRPACTAESSFGAIGSAHPSRHVGCALRSTSMGHWAALLSLFGARPVACPDSGSFGPCSRPCLTFGTRLPSGKTGKTRLRVLGLGRSPCSVSPQGTC
jgi:hypothetical protein